MNIEALAMELAMEDVYDWTMGDRWFGWPDPDDPEQMEQAIEGRMPWAREKAQRYADILMSGEQGAHDNG